MTTPVRHAEADRVELVYYWALNQLGNAMAIDSRQLWQGVPANAKAAQADWWLTRIVRLMFGFRSEAQKLAIAHYRLTRALRTGYAPTYGSESPGDATTLEALRQEFEDIVNHIDRETSADGQTSPEPDYTHTDVDADIQLEHVADIDKMIADADEAARAEAIDVLDNLGLNNLIKKLDEGMDPAEAHSMAGDRGAAAAMRITMNAARNLTYDLADTDVRVQAWVRYSQTGTPCGWCAMLISRGPVYKTERAAQHQGARQEEEKFHDNCHCVAVPIFLQEQYDSSSLFDLNRKYDELWQDHIKGKFSGDLALTKWRYYVRYGFPNEASVQAAA